MKTPIQDLIKQLKETEQFITDENSELDQFYRGGLREAINKAESMLEKEKEVICKFASNYGLCEWCGCDYGKAEKYYNETFNTKEI